jgi:hypothetical protein
MKIVKKNGIIEPTPSMLASLKVPVKIYPNTIQYTNIKDLQEKVLASDLALLSAI